MENTPLDRILTIFEIAIRVVFTLIAIGMLLSFIPFLFLEMFLIRDLNYWYLPYLAMLVFVVGGGIMSLLYPHERYSA